MKYKGRRGSANVEDRRGMGGGGKTLIGGGIGGLIIVLIITFMGGNPGEILNDLGTSDTNQNVPYEQTEEEKELAEFVSVVLADTEEVWTNLFAEEGMTYKEPKLVLYSGSVQSACGVAGSAVGPFYCPGDQKIVHRLEFLSRTAEQVSSSG